MNVWEICWVKIYIRHIYENVLIFSLIYEFNSKVFKEKMVSFIMGHPVNTRPCRTWWFVVLQTLKSIDTKKVQYAMLETAWAILKKIAALPLPKKSTNKTSVFMIIIKIKPIFNLIRRWRIFVQCMRKRKLFFRQQ